MRRSSSARTEGEGLENALRSSFTDQAERMLMRVLGEVDLMNLMVWGGGGDMFGFWLMVGRGERGVCRGERREERGRIWMWMEIGWWGIGGMSMTDSVP